MPDKKGGKNITGIDKRNIVNESVVEKTKKLKFRLT